MRFRDLVVLGALLAIVLTAWSTNPALRQAVANDQADTYFVFIFRRGSAWVEGTGMRQQPSLNGHFAHMQKLQDAGQLVLGGPFTDETGVLGVLRVNGLDEAKRLVQADPMVRARVVEAEVHPWRPSVAGCVGKGAH